MGSAYSVASISDATIRALNYSPEVDRLRAIPSRVRARGWSQGTLGTLAAEVGKTYARVLQRVDCDEDQGDELLGQVDIFAAQPDGRHIRGDLMSFVEDLRIRHGDVLIAGAGQMGESTLFGRALIADARVVGKLAAGDVMIVRFADAAASLSLFTYAFLVSSAGLRSIRAAAYGTSIPRMRPDLLFALPVPLPDESIQARVAEHVRACMEHRERYAEELRAARALIEAMPEMKEATAICARRKRRAIAWTDSLPTLCAWNYASTGDALALLRKRWSARLGDVLEPDGVFNGPRFSRVDCQPPHGIDFYSQRDVFMMRPAPRRIARPPISDRNLFVPKHAVLAGSHGQLTDGGIFGKVELASFGACNGGLTQDLLRLLFKPEERAFAFAFLSTRVGERLLKSTAVGTSIPSMRLDLLVNLPYPTAAKRQREDVTKHVEAAERARIAASDAERAAIAIVEEEVLSVWLG